MRGDYWIFHLIAPVNTGINICKMLINSKAPYVPILITDNVIKYKMWPYKWFADGK